MLRPTAAASLSTEEGHEKGSEWYDATFESVDHWRSHYSQSEYYFIWTVIVDRLLTINAKSVLEIACGTGQLACLINDKGVQKYSGFDFSPKRIEQAKRACPEFSFRVEDAFKTDLFATFPYDAVICTEFLEHIDNDIEILKRIKPGSKFYGTVPNFPFVSHVRYFESAEEVINRYQRSFAELRVDTLLAAPDGKKFYLLDGRIA